MLKLYEKKNISSDLSTREEQLMVTDQKVLFRDLSHNFKGFFTQ